MLTVKTYEPLTLKVGRSLVKTFVSCGLVDLEKAEWVNIRLQQFIKILSFVPFGNGPKTLNMFYSHQNKLVPFLKQMKVSNF